MKGSCSGGRGLRRREALGLPELAGAFVRAHFTGIEKAPAMKSRNGRRALRHPDHCRRLIHANETNGQGPGISSAR